MATMASVSSTEVSKDKKSYHPPRPRKFAPVDPEKSKAKAAEGLPTLKGIIFDVDGTLCLPQNYMFREMRSALDIPKSVDILDHIRSLSDQPDDQSPPSSSSLTTSSPQSRAMSKIQDIERNAMKSQKPQPGLVELMTYLSRTRQLRVGLCTRNFPAPVQHLIDHFLAPHGVDFSEEEVVTRDTKGIKPKPSPEGIWKIAKYWAMDLEGGTSSINGDTGSEDFITSKKQDGAIDGRVDGESADALDLAKKYLGSGLIMVGDSVDDMAAGYRAGAATVLLVNEDNEDLATHEYTDLAIKRLDELIDVLENGLVGRDC